MLRDVGAEDEQRRKVGELEEAERDDDRDEPRARDELVPAVAEVGQHAPARDPQRSWKIDAHEQKCAHREGQGVGRQRPARLGHGNDGGPDGRPGDADRRVREPHERVRLLEVGALHHLRHETLVRGARKGSRAAVEGLQQRNREDARRSGDQQCRGDCLRGAAHPVGGDENEVTGQAVAPHTAHQQQDDDRNLAGEDDEAEVARPADVEHGECERDVGHRPADDGDRSRCEQQPKPPLAKRVEADEKTHRPSLRERPERRQRRVRERRSAIQATARRPSQIGVRTT